MKQNKTKRVLAGLAGFLMIGALLFVANSFVGNPIWGGIAKGKITAYVQQHYPSEYRVGKVSYNFKFGEYMATVQSKISEDKFFTVSYREGKVEDDYQVRVLNRFNTYARISKEYDQFLESFFAENKKSFPYQCDLILGDLRIDEKKQYALELDMPFDAYNMPSPTSVTVWTVCENPSDELLATQLKQLCVLFDKANLPVQLISISIKSPEDEHWGNSVGVDELSAETIRSSENLIADIATQRASFEQKYTK